MSTGREAEARRADIARDAVPSPCISVCEMMPEAGVCAGCFRTLDEIAVWGLLDDAQKRAVLGALPERRARWAPPT